MNHRCVLTTMLLVCLALDVLAVSPVSADAPPRRPNILWIITEDMGPELACYGTPQVSTPNVDRLAAGGVRFTSAYTTAPVCSASRSAFNTGLYQTTIGAHNHRSHRTDGFLQSVLEQWLVDSDDQGRFHEPASSVSK